MDNCAECGTITNHTTAQHLAVVEESSRCIECDSSPRRDGDPDTLLCEGCHISRQASYYYPGGD